MERSVNQVFLLILNYVNSEGLYNAYSLEDDSIHINIEGIVFDIQRQVTSYSGEMFSLMANGSELSQVVHRYDASLFIEMYKPFMRVKSESILRKRLAASLDEFDNAIRFLDNYFKPKHN